MTDIAWINERPIAHRGYHDLNKTRWENTLSAFAAAVERGFAIECDVHLSADGVPVVFHDDDLKRLTGTEGLCLAAKCCRARGIEHRRHGRPDRRRWRKCCRWSAAACRW